MVKLIMAFTDIFDKHTLAGLKGAGIAIENAMLKAASGLTGGLSNTLLDKISPSYRQVESELASELNLDLDTVASKGLEFLGEMALIGKVAGGATKLVGLSKIAKSSKLLPRITTRLAGGAATGAGLESLKFMAGNSTPEEIAKEAVIWGGIEGAFGVAGIGVSKGLSKLSKGLKSYQKNVNAPSIINKLKDKLKIPHKQFQNILKDNTGKEDLTKLSMKESSDMIDGLLGMVRERGNTKLIHESMTSLAEGSAKAIRTTGRVFKENEILSFADKIKKNTRNILNKLVYKPQIRLDRLLERVDRYTDGIHTKQYDNIAQGYNKSKIATAADEEILIRTLEGSGLATRGKLGVNVNKDMFKEHVFVSNPKKFFTTNEALNAHLGANELSYGKDELNHHLKHLVNYNGRTKAEVKEMVSFIEKNPNLKRISDVVGEQYKTKGAVVAKTHQSLTGDQLENIQNYAPIRLKPEKGLKTTDDMMDSLFGQLGKSSVDRPSVIMKRGEAIGEVSEDFLGNYIHNVNKMNNYINMADSLHKSNILFKNKDWAKAVKGRFGEDYYNAIMQNMESIYNPTYNMTNSLLDPMMKMLRKNSTTYALGFNALTGLKQPISFINGMGEVGFTNAMKSIVKNPAKLIKQASVKSNFMKNRSAYREIEETVSKGKILQGTRDKIDKVAMGHIKWMDKVTASSIWDAQYNKFLSKNAGKYSDAILEKRAIEAADKVVRRTQPAASMADLPLLFKGGELSKLFTMFSNQLNQNFNTIVHDVLGKASAGAISKPEALRKVMFTVLLPATVMSAVATGGNSISKAISGDDPTDLVTDMALYPISSIALIGNMVNSYSKGFGDITPMPLKTISRVLDIGRKKTVGAKLGASLDALSRLGGIPAVQAKRSLQGILELSSGESDDMRKLFWSSYALDEKKKKKKKKNMFDFPAISGLKGLGKIKL